MSQQTAATVSAEGAVTTRLDVLRAERFVSLDVFRGITIAAMILVNNPGNWHDVYWPLEHANWNGCTPTDWIFPFFLFIVGVAVTFSFARRLGRGDTLPKVLAKIARRTLIIFALGIVLNGFPFFDWSTLRIPGVLQRIAVCYCVVAIIVLFADVRGQAGIAALLLVGYWILMKYVPVPGYGPGDLGPNGNLAAYVDTVVMPGHLWRPHWDPEGILSTLPAIATTLCGALTGHWLRSGRTALERVAGLFAAGTVAVALGLSMDSWFPINKNLWTSSYTVFTAGVALDCLAMCYWLIDIQGYRRWASPFVIYGTNPIAAYLFSSLMAKALLLWRVTLSDGERVHLKKLIFDRLFLSWASPVNASLFFAIAYVLLWLALTGVLYRRQIFIKI